MTRRMEHERVDPQDPNIKTRFHSVEELVGFLYEYDMPFPCTIHIWHDRLRSTWHVAPEPGSVRRSQKSGTERRRTAGATRPTYRTDQLRTRAPSGPFRGL